MIPGRRVGSRVLLGQTVAFAVFLAVLSGVLASAVAEDLREWTDSAGKYSVKAKLLSVASGKVTLVREDDSQVEVELTKLSEADQQYVKNWKSDDDNPFKPKTPTELQGSPGGPATSLTGDFTGVTPLEMLPAQGGWQLSVNATAPRKAVENLRPIPIPPKTDFSETAAALVTNDVCGRAVIGYTLRRGMGQSHTRLVLCDLKGGNVLATVTGTESMVPLALADDGAQVLMRPKEGVSSNNEQLQFWTVTPDGIEVGLKWIPYGSFKSGQRGVKWAAFLDAKRVVTVGSNGKLAVWEIGSPKPLYYLEIAGACHPALSPDRKWLAFSTGKQIGILDVDAGKVLALESAPGLQFPVMQFSPDASRLACAAFNKLYVWDVATGELYREMPLKDIVVGGDLLFPDPGYVLVAKRYLFDLANQVKLWDYQNGDLVEACGGLSWFVVSQGQKGAGALVPLTVPHASVQETIEKAMKDPDFFVLKPGVTVRLLVDAIADPEGREKTRTALQEKLESLGFKVGDDGTIDLVASGEMGEEREITYHSFPRRYRTYKFRPWVSALKFVYQGDTAWQTRSTNVPGIVMLKEGDTMEAYLKRQEKPTYVFFQHVELPKVLRKPTGSPTLGVSKLTVAGLQ